MLYYPYKMMFSAYKTVIGSPCACDLFVSKVTKITRYMDVRFWRSFFGAFSVCGDCILKSTKVGRTSLSLALGNMVVARQILLIFNLSYLPSSVQFVNKNYCHAKNDLFTTC